jgi:hypothetical protein
LGFICDCCISNVCLLSTFSFSLDPTSPSHRFIRVLW